MNKISVALIYLFVVSGCSDYQLPERNNFNQVSLINTQRHPDSNTIVPELRLIIQMQAINERRNIQDHFTLEQFANIVITSSEVTNQIDRNEGLFVQIINSVDRKMLSRFASQDDLEKASMLIDTWM